MSDIESRKELAHALVQATQDHKTEKPRAVSIQLSKLDAPFTVLLICAGLGGFLDAQRLDVNGAPMGLIHINPDYIVAWRLWEDKA